MSEPGVQTVQHDGTLEGRVQALEIRMALAEQNIGQIDAKLSKISNSIDRVTWLIVSAIGLALLNMVFKGGVL